MRERSSREVITRRTQTPHGEFLLDEDADVVPGSKSGRVRDEVDWIREIVDDEAERDDPEEDLDKSYNRNNETAARARSMILSVSRLTSITRAPKTRSGMRIGVRAPAERKSIWGNRPAGYKRVQLRTGRNPGSA